MPGVASHIARAVELRHQHPEQDRRDEAYRERDQALPVPQPQSAHAGRLVAVPSLPPVSDSSRRVASRAAPLKVALASPGIHDGDSRAGPFGTAGGVGHRPRLRYLVDAQRSPATPDRRHHIRGVRATARLPGHAAGRPARPEMALGRELLAGDRGRRGSAGSVLPRRPGRRRAAAGSPAACARPAARTPIPPPRSCADPAAAPGRRGPTSTRTSSPSPGMRTRRGFRSWRSVVVCRP